MSIKSDDNRCRRNDIQPLVVFTWHVIKNKIRKHLIHELKILAYDRFLSCKTSCKDLDLCSFSYMKYSEKCFNQIYRALCGDAMIVSLMAAVERFKNSRC